MLKKLFAALLALLAAAAFAATDVNKADQAELEAVKGIGPAISQRLLDERRKGAFKDWPDLIERVKGIGSGNAARFSAGGMTVNGSAYAGAPAKAAAKTPGGRRDRTAASQPAASAASPAMAATDRPAMGRPAAASGIDKPARKAAGAASTPRAAPAAASAASAVKAGAKP